MFTSEYNPGQNTYSNNRNSEPFCTGTRIAALTCTLLLAAAIIPPSVIIPPLRREARRLDSMVNPAVKQLQALDSAATEQLSKSNCTQALESYKDFRREKGVACEEGFHQFVSDLVKSDNCMDANTTEALLDIANEFETGQAEQAKEGESHLTVACSQRHDQVQSAIDFDQEGECFKTGFELNGFMNNYTETLADQSCSIDQPFDTFKNSVNGTLTNFVNMTDEMCANPDPAFAALKNCQSEKTAELEARLREFTEPSSLATDKSCYQRSCEQKSSIADIVSVEIDRDDDQTHHHYYPYSHGRFYGLGVYHLLFSASDDTNSRYRYRGGNRKVTTRTRGSSTVKGGSNYGGGKTGLRGSNNVGRPSSSSGAKGSSSFGGAKGSSSSGGGTSVGG